MAGGWPGEEWAIPAIPARPVVLPTRPGRHRPRQASEHLNPHQPVYYRDANGQLFVPAGDFGGGLHRSVSAAGNRGAPAVAVINNWEDRPRSSGEDWEERAHSPARRHHHHHHHHHEDRSRSRHRERDESPYKLDYEIERKVKLAEELERNEAEKELQKRVEEQLIIKQAKEEEAKAKKKKEEKEMEEKIIAEWQIKEKEKAEKAKKKKQEEDEEFRERVIKTFGAAGYSQEHLDQILKQGDKGGKQEKKIMDLSRPTYIKVHRKYLSPATLDAYELPWEWDEVSLHIA